MNILDVIWFCAGHGNVGIVKVQDNNEGIIYYIGQCGGMNENIDKMWIADWGSRFPTDAGKALFND